MERKDKEGRFSFLLEKTKENPMLTLSVLALLVIPLFIREVYFLHIFVIIMIHSVISTSWNLTLGYSGVFNFAHLAFFGIGGYTSGMLSNYLGINPWGAMLIASLVTVLVSLVCAVPTLKLKGIYVFLFTFAFQGIISALILFNPYGLTGGGIGLRDIPPFTIGPIDFSGSDNIPPYYLALFFLLISTYCFYKIINSSVGLSFVALRDNEDYAISQGIDPYKYKLIAWIVSAFFVGLIGAFFAHYQGIITLDIFSFTLLSSLLAGLVVGGMGTIYGPIIGAFVMTGLEEFLRILGWGGYRLIAIAVITILILLFVPGGLSQGIKTIVEKLGFKKKRR